MQKILIQGYLNAHYVRMASYAMYLWYMGSTRAPQK